jgi:ketosteroid isomerase-like protein
MSQQDLDLLRTGYDAFAAGDVEAALALLSPDIELQVHTERPDIQSRTYHGHAGFLANFSELTDVFDDLRVEPTEFIEGNGRVLAIVRVTGSGKASGVAIEAKIFHVWTFRDGKATRLEIFGESEQAEQALRKGPVGRRQSD